MIREIASLIIPKKQPVPPYKATIASESNCSFAVSVVIPSYKPTNNLLELIEDLLANPLVRQLIVVDDATPTGEGREVFESSCNKHQDEKRFVLIRNEHNLMCAGAVNRGLSLIEPLPSARHGILVINDDAKLEPDAISHLCLKLWSRETLGAVCTQARVLNAKRNLITRLQRLEYLSFNIARKSDEGFLKGPLIMPGLATLFRAHLLLDKLKGYDTSCLIEDYEMTVRLKKLGYDVALAENAIAWTIVPETLKQLVKQRVRWYYGGLTVLRRHWNAFSATLPDLISHALNIGLLTLIILSFVVPTGGPEEPDGYFTLRGVLLSFGMFGLFLNIMFMLWLDSEKDWVDILIRCTFIVEMYYQTVLSYVIFGSYAFYVYQSMKRRICKKSERQNNVFVVLDNVFRRMGFTATWGTK